VGLAATAGGADVNLVTSLRLGGGGGGCLPLARGVTVDCAVRVTRVSTRWQCSATVASPPWLAVAGKCEP